MHELTKLIKDDMRPALGVTEPEAITIDTLIEYWNTYCKSCKSLARRQNAVCAMTALMKSGEETTDIHIHNSRIYPTDSLEYYTYFKEYRQKYDIGTEVEHKLSMEPEEVE